MTILKKNIVMNILLCIGTHYGWHLKRGYRLKGLVIKVRSRFECSKWFIEKKCPTATRIIIFIASELPGILRNGTEKSRGKSICINVRAPARAHVYVSVPEI